MPSPWDYAKTTEHSHQAALFMWANMAQRFGLAAANDPLSYTKPGHAMSYKQPADGHKPVHPLKWLHAVHNQGHGDAIRGGKAKAEGVKAGVSDIFLPYPMTRAGAYNGAFPASVKHGLYIELKPPLKGRTSPEQVEFQSDMSMLGYACHVARGWLEARKIICEYLDLPLDS